MQGTDGDLSAGVASAQGRKLGRYLLRTRLAQGGMASVYLSQLLGSEGFNKWLAVKVIHPQIAEDPNFVQMFLNEARLAARLDHPNICTVFDFGEADGTYFLAMEFLHGEALTNLLKKAWAVGAPGMPLHLAARIVADAAQGLHAAHELKGDDGESMGVVHRDISPQNVFVLYSGVTKVVDFGIARSSENAGEKTAMGVVKGKAAYMAPEQARGDQHLDRRADIWALGVVLWELTLGKRLFKRSTDVATILSVIQEPILRPRTLATEYPVELERIVMKALERDPDQRYETARAMARDLEQFLLKAGHSAQAGDVAEFMEGCFREEISKQQKLLRAVAANEVAGEGLSGVSGSFRALPSQPPGRKGEGSGKVATGGPPPLPDSEPKASPSWSPRPALPRPSSPSPPSAFASSGFSKAPAFPTPPPPSSLPVRRPQETIPIPLAKPAGGTRVGAIAPASSTAAHKALPPLLPAEPVPSLDPVPSLPTGTNPALQAAPAPASRAPAIIVLVLVVLSFGALIGALMGRRSNSGTRIETLPPGTVVVLPNPPATPPPAPIPAPAPVPVVAGPPPAPAAPEPPPALAPPSEAVVPPGETPVERPGHRHGHRDPVVAAGAAPAEGALVAPGYLSVGGPGVSGSVFEGSHRLGSVPLSRLSLPAGTHRLRIVTEEGSAQAVVVDVQSGAETFVPVTMQ